jgi:hypothetical protein
MPFFMEKYANIACLFILLLYVKNITARVWAIKPCHHLEKEKNTNCLLQPVGMWGSRVWHEK